MDDLRERLERLAARVDDRPGSLAELERRRAARGRARRVGAAALALVVGAGATFGVVRAFDEGEGRVAQTPDGAWAPPAVLTIWPEGPSRHVTVDPANVQAAVDAGDPSVQWRTDPREVALRFAESVLSWEVRDVVGMGAERHPVLGTPGTFFLLSSCPANARCYVTYLEEVHLVQPARRGDGGIWSVGWVIADITSPQLDAGEHLGESALIRFNEYGYGNADRPIFGLEWFDGCAVGRTAEHVRGDRQPTISLFTLSIPPLTGGCSPVAVGLAYAVRLDEGFEDPIDVVDPFAGGATDVSAVPFTFDVPTAAAEGTSTTYTDPLGWSIDYPSGWTALPIDASDGRISMSGAAFSDGSLVPADDGSKSPWPDLSRLSPDQVVVIVTHTDGGLAPRIADDSSFPLRPGDAAILNAEPPLERLLEFRGDGLVFAAWWGPADGGLSSQDVMEEMIRTIRFEPWELGDVRNGFRSIGRAASFREGGDYSYAGRLQTIFVVRRQDAYVVLDVPNFGCEGPPWVLEGSTDLITTTEAACPVDLWYDLDGNPDPRNPPEYQQPLDVYPVIRAHDGSLLVAVDG